MVSLLKAFELGADGVETDVRFTADGVPVLIHDESLDRLCGVDAKLRDLTLRELKKLRVEGEEIPTLEEFLKVIPAGRWVNLELKESDGAEFAVELARRTYDGELVFSSFNHETISRLKSQYQSLKFGYLFGDEHRSMNLEDVLNLFEHSTFSAHLPVVLVSQDLGMFKTLVSDLKRRGIKIVLWTVNNLRELEEVREFVDFVITDDVRLFLEAHGTRA